MRLFDSTLSSVMQGWSIFYGNVQARCKGRPGLTWGHLEALPANLGCPRGPNAPVVASVDAAAAIADASNEVNSLIDSAIHETGCIYLGGLPVKTAGIFL